MYLPELQLVPGLTESRGYTQIALCCVFVISYYKLDHWIMQFQSFIGLAIKVYEKLHVYHALQIW